MIYGSYERYLKVFLYLNFNLFTNKEIEQVHHWHKKFREGDWAPQQLTRNVLIQQLYMGG